ncbi:MAG: dihydrolipoyl dehydrogenase [Xanthomonadales bacterium]|nr:dihydrolipoyl dehydrogenase [Xanthomonadales bacterium]
MTEQFDLIVIGAGPAGYVAAIHAAQLGLKTACIDKTIGKDGQAAPGGTCLNVGCIPSKALLDSSKHYDHLQHTYAEHGISADNVSMDVGTMIGRKDKIVKQLTGGISQLFKANKVTFFHGTASLEKDHRVTVNQVSGDAVELQGKNILLASGSVSIEIPGVAFDGEYIIDNTAALDINTVPKRLGVIGAGVIGLELGSVWSRLGSEVTIFEALPEFLGVADKDIAKLAAREFRKQKLDIKLNTMVKSASVKGQQVEVTIDTKDGEQQLSFDRLLVAVGRKAFTEGLLAEGCGVKLSERGQIEVDDNCLTSSAGVYAIGDAVRGPMLAHKASEEGVAVVNRIAGKHGHLDFNTIPWVIYTEPEIAWVGKTEQQLKADGIEYKSGSFPFAANGRALAGGAPAGMVKLLADATTDELLGAHIIGANASELIAECVVTMEFHGSSEDLALIVHAHPTLSEAVHEAALNIHKHAIHRVN